MISRLLLRSIPQSPRPSPFLIIYFFLSSFSLFLIRLPPSHPTLRLMKWPYLILWSPWERCNCIKTVNPCPYNCYRCLSLLSPLSLSIASLSPSLPPHIFSLKSSKSVLHNLYFYFFSPRAPKVVHVCNLTLCFCRICFGVCLLSALLIPQSSSRTLFITQSADGLLSRN